MNFLSCFNNIYLCTSQNKVYLVGSPSCAIHRSILRILYVVLCFLTFIIFLHSICDKLQVYSLSQQGLNKQSALQARDKAKSILKYFPPSLFISDSLASSLAHAQTNIPAVGRINNKHNIPSQEHQKIPSYSYSKIATNLYKFICTIPGFSTIYTLNRLEIQHSPTYR